MSETQIIVRKIQLIPVGDKEEINRVYTYLRDGIKSQNMAMNQYMSALYSAMVVDVSKDDRKELNHLFSRISTSKLGSAYDETIKFAKGLPSASSVAQKVKQDFDNAMKKGLKYGKLSLPTYRDNNPLLLHVDYVRLRATNPHLDNGLYHNYESHEDFLDNLYSKKLELFIKFEIEPGKDRRDNVLKIIRVRDIPLYCDQEWDFVIIDEVHKLLGSVIYRACHDLSKKAANIILLSATPVQQKEGQYLELLQLILPEKYDEVSLEDFKEQVTKQKKITQLLKRMKLLKKMLL